MHAASTKNRRLQNNVTATATVCDHNAMNTKSSLFLHSKDR